MKKVIIILGILLALSSALNVYLYLRKVHWQEAWLNQFITTAEVESLLKEAGGDTSIEKIRNIAINRFGKSSVYVVDLQGRFQEFDSDNTALGVNDTLILFKNGQYHGSKANLPDH